MTKMIKILNQISLYTNLTEVQKTGVRTKGLNTPETKPVNAVTSQSNACPMRIMGCVLYNFYDTTDWS